VCIWRGAAQLLLAIFSEPVHSKLDGNMGNNTVLWARLYDFLLSRNALGYLIFALQRLASELLRKIWLLVQLMTQFYCGLAMTERGVFQARCETSNPVVFLF
jgi:hypothetical protein